MRPCKINDFFDIKKDSFGSVTREDLVQSLSMLDMAVYNNVFVNEEVGMGKKGNGVKVDRATPLGHLRDAKSQLDEVLALAKSG